MASRTPHIRTLLRATTTIRTTHLPIQPTQFSTLSPTTPHLRRPRSPSPPPPYTPTPAPLSTLSLSHAGPQYPAPPTYTPWTRFTTPYSYSSVRTFTSSRAHLLPPTSPSPSSSPDAAARIDPIIEEITELYGTARDEFEIAAEETEKNTTYAAEDRAAAREELDRLLRYYEGVLGEGADRAVAEEVKRRVGQRIRELEQAVLALEESVTHGD
ncbi:hypothetical protein K491DRAFT_694604 [Lophiostoma macrostomum CBS 122681]|uniref:BAG domain-containing protein n=1 Tax=Lophiostoma macrostomum CBS 122681 TaxID=1314788 RepID=A0A6A6T0J6_9PLEO|nr:hypothetical protein K491DRAFT_694604 [Lophiostoma macrostomum CBS 122681]